MTTCPSVGSGRRRAGPWGWTLGLLLAVAGCPSFMDEEPLPQTENTCTTDADCDEDAQCQAQVCVATRTAEQSVVLQITPPTTPEGRAALSSYIDVARVSGPTTTPPIALPLPVELTISMQDGDRPIPGRVRVSTIDAPPGLGDSITGDIRMDGSSAEVTLEVPEGGSYLVRAIPATEDGAALPPMQREITADEDQTVAFDFGELVHQDYAFVGLQPGVAMEAYARQAGGDRQISTRAAVDDGGLVTLTYPPGDLGDYRIELRPRSAPATGIEEGLLEAASDAGEDEVALCGSPAHLEAAAVTYVIDPDPLAPAQDGLIEVPLPVPMPAIEYTGPVTLCEGAANQPRTVGVAAIRLVSQELQVTEGTAVPGVQVHYSYQDESAARYDDNTGMLTYCIAAFPGTYQVVAYAPSTVGLCEQGQDRESAQCGCGVLSTERLIQAPPGVGYQRGTEIALPSIASISGHLTDSDGTPVVGAPVEAKAHEAGSEAGTIAAFSRSRSAISDEIGAFRLALDVGAYDVTIKPAADSGFAWVVHRDVLIGNQTQEFTKRLSMSTPVYLTGTVSYEDGGDAANASLAGSRVHAFSVVRDESQGTGRSIKLGETTADEEGRFTLLLPAEVPVGWF